MEGLFAFLSIPILALNFLGGIIGGIGLLIQGDWATFFWGLAYSIGGSFILGFLLLPGMIFVPLMLWAAKRGSRVLLLLTGLPPLLWTHLVMGVSSAIAFSIIAAKGDAGFFHVLWGYSVATGPWSFMANKERQGGNPDAAVPLFFCQAGVISMMVASFIDNSDLTFERLIIWYLPFAALGVLTQLFIAWIETQSGNAFPQNMIVPASRVIESDESE